MRRLPLISKMIRSDYRIVYNKLVETNLTTSELRTANGKSTDHMAARRIHQYQGH